MRAIKKHNTQRFINKYLNGQAFYLENANGTRTLNGVSQLVLQLNDYEEEVLITKEYDGEAFIFDIDTTNEVLKEEVISALTDNGTITNIVIKETKEL